MSVVLNDLLLFSCLTALVTGIVIALLNNMGDVALGIETAYFYSAAHPSEKNKAFVEGVKQANNGMRANLFGVSGYDGMHLILKRSEKQAAKQMAIASLAQ
jgi:branched-chain amino acid transport system substrate-binding protein